MEKILEDLLSVLGEDRFRMELHALERLELSMADAHNLAPVRAGGHDEFLLDRLGLGEQRVIAGRLKFLRQPGEHAFAVVNDLRGLPVHETAGADDVAAESVTDGLMPQAHAQNRDLAAQLLDEIDDDAGILRTAGDRKSVV